MSAIERALSLNASCATALYFGSPIYAFAGHPVAATSNANRALRLSPFDPVVFLAHLALGLAAIAGGALRRGGIALLQRPCRRILASALSYFFHAASLALAGRQEEAAQVARRYMEMVPSARIAMLSEFGFASALTGKLIEGVRLLGLPE